jgi:hypothetical protein
MQPDHNRAGSSAVRAVDRCSARHCGSAGRPGSRFWRTSGISVGAPAADGSFPTERKYRARHRGGLDPTLVPHPLFARSGHRCLQTILLTTRPKQQSAALDVWLPQRSSRGSAARPLRQRRGLRSILSPWKVKRSQTVRVHGGVAADPGACVAPPEPGGGVAESQVTVLERAERACVSLDDRDRAGMPIRSNRRVTKRTTD